MAPGFRVPTLSHATGPIRATSSKNCSSIRTDSASPTRRRQVSALSPDGDRWWSGMMRGRPPRVCAHGRRKTPRPGRPFSIAEHARRADRRRSSSTRRRRSTRRPHAMCSRLMQTLGTFRSLPKADQWRLLRWGPMAVADLVGESIETELLRAAVAADGVFGAMLGPWSAGSGLQLLLTSANRSLRWPAAAWSAAGPSRSRARSKARARSIWRRDPHRRGRRAHRGQGRSRDRRDPQRRPAYRSARGGLRRSIPSARSLVVRGRASAARIPLADKHYRTRGTLAKVNLALSSLPPFAGATRDMLAGRVRIAPDLDYLERAFDHAKYGRYSPHPGSNSRCRRSTIRRSRPRRARVVRVRAVCALFLARQATGTSSRDAFGDAVVNTLAQYAPDINSTIVAAEILTPLDFERGWGLSGGHIFHGELSLDQFFTMRPLLGYGRYQTPFAGCFSAAQVRIQAPG